MNRHCWGNGPPTDPRPEPGTEGYFKVERDDPASKAYRITAITTPERGKAPVAPQTFKAYLVRLGTSTFLDVIVPREAGDPAGQSDHLAWIVEIKKSELALCSLRQDFIKAHPDSIPQVERRSPLGISHLRVTATTRELRVFVGKNAEVEAAWENPAQSLKRLREP